jgi:hypothetical protein
MSKTYEVTSPDGKVYEVTAPEGATEEQIISYAKSQFSAPEAPKQKGRLNPQQQAAFDDVMKGRPWGSGFGPAVHELGGKVTDVTGSPAAGAVTNFVANAIPAALSGRVEGAQVGSLVDNPVTGWIPRKLMQSAVKPSTAKYSPKEIKQGMDTMLREQIVPTPSGVDEGAALVNKIHQGVEKSIEGSQANVGVSAVTSRLDDPMKRFGMQVNPQQDVAAVEDVWTKFLTNQHIQGKKEIPVQLAHKMKQGTYQALGGKSYGEVGSASTEAQKALARGLREEVGTAVPSVLAPLKREAEILNALEMASARAAQQGNLNPFGLGALRLDHLPSAALTMADRIAAIKAYAGLIPYQMGRPEMLYPAGITGGMLYQDRTKP